MKDSSLDALGAIPVEVDTDTGLVTPLMPRVLHKGVYTLYEKPDGTLRIQYRRTDRDEDDFMEIPGAILRLAKAASEGKLNPMEAMRALRAGNIDGAKL